jgi:putrescine aminotransferase
MNIITLEDALTLDRGEARELYARYINPGIASLVHLLDIDRNFVRAEGACVWDDTGREHLDFLGGFGALNTGHNHPEVQAAVRRVVEAPNLLQIGLSRLVGALGQSLAAITPGALEKTFLCNSGSEAVEAALKLARASTGRTRIISTHNAYHGLTFGALSATGREHYRKPFAPLVPGFAHVPFGDLDALERELNGAPPAAAFVVEPIQGEGGIVVPPAGYLRSARDLCHRHGALFIADEVQTGFGRTGRMFGVDHEGVVPDIMALAKSLGGGIAPIGACIATDEVWRRAYGSRDTCMLHDSTFGGNALACAAALKAIEVIVRDDLPGRAATLGRRFRERLDGIAARSHIVHGVRGQGLLLGLEFAEPPVAKGLSREYFAAMFASVLLHDHNIITAYALNATNILRLEPPLVVTESQLDRAADAIEEVSQHYRSVIGLVLAFGRRAAGRQLPHFELPPIGRRR